MVVVVCGVGVPAGWYGSIQLAWCGDRYGQRMGSAGYKLQDPHGAMA